MCQIVSLLSGWWLSPFGLVLDLIGVGLLGYDLIRVQRMLRAQAKDDLSHFEAMAEEYDGVDSWIDEINKSARWIPESAYSDHHAEDGVSYNAHRAIEQLDEVTQCMSLLASHLAKVVSLQRQQAQGNNRAANASLRYSILGLIFIFFGFVLQMLGSLHC
jgi:hypothetical protein